MIKGLATERFFKLFCGKAFLFSGNGKKVMYTICVGMVFDNSKYILLLRSRHDVIFHHDEYEELQM